MLLELFNPLLAGATFVFIFTRAFQQRNVGGLNYKWVMPTSFLMAVLEVFTITTIVKSGYSVGTVISCTVGGGFGSMAAMYLHSHYVNRGLTNEA